MLVETPKTLLINILLAEMPLNELNEMFLALAKRLYAYRKANNGFVPKEIFEACVGMSGMSVSVQIVNEVVDAKGMHIGYAMKQRDSSELGDAWACLYHSTCTTARLQDTPATMLGRDTKETFGVTKPEERLEYLGVTIHDEPERWSSCLTVMHRRMVATEEVSQFTGTWKIFSDNDIRYHNKEIIDHNWYLLEWVLDPDRPLFADVRGGWWHGKDRGEPRPE
ncbi:MAG: hypothetical protein A3D65_04870 [Candidatus Lloydbacteria bacterium RIFCSPHIGHO2_02_FULL_50_13]|uniref:Nudix hydrolase domain-containing protein n=1 Tax=Candidatus Lloydbacteria bacterium RIFCSPHIGHO2_02_FULL_50_13 TaxID=1798661 RepID=A0A1G2D723_9BACT|nr:MAG: hypothetical protein A3D65_04870 [Candidatus Lloydbacteria bacterium RIFCSPHIGHO2_02_FULL_50_13]